MTHNIIEPKSCGKKRAENDRFVDEHDGKNLDTPIYWARENLENFIKRLKTKSSLQRT